MIPIELITSPCSAIRHGDGSVNQLAQAYITNVGCIRKHEVMLDNLHIYLNNNNK